MPRGKTPAGLIEDVRKRRLAFTTRRKGFMSKAKELATLCDVPVAAVCADLKGGGPPTVLETVPGVLDRYRALPAERRAADTHVKYLRGLLQKERAKLAKLRQAGPDLLAPPHRAMGLMTVEELQGLLAYLDVALAAVAARRRALGLPAGDDEGGAVVVPPPGDGGYLHPVQQQQQHQQGQGILDQPMMILPGTQAHGGGGMIIPFPPEYYIGGMNMVHGGGGTIPPPEYYLGGMNMVHGPQPQYNLGGYPYQQQMPINGGGYQQQMPGACVLQPHNAIAQQPWDDSFLYGYGDASRRLSSHVGMTPSNGNFNNGAVHDLAIGSPAESSNATIAGYPYMHTSVIIPPPGARYPTSQFTSDENAFLDELLFMGARGNLQGGHETQGSSSTNLQHSGSGASQNSSSVQGSDE